MCIHFHKDAMTQNTALIVDTHSIASRRKSVGSRKRKRGEGTPVTSRYFKGIAPANNSFRFTTIVSPDSKCRSNSPTAENAAKARRRIVENEQDEESCGYNLFAEVRSDALVNANGATSDYFLRSPSSAFGSVRSLGPLVYTWIGGSSRDEIRRECSLRISSNGKPCDVCSKILERDAFRHFQRCPIFRKQFNDYRKNDFKRDGCLGGVGENNLQPTCVELVGRWAEECALRHVCPNQCFLRAFAPSRDWCILRKHLRTITPIGELLSDWTCRLVDDKETNGQTLQCNFHELFCMKQDIKLEHSLSGIGSKGRQPRTSFVSLKTGKSFASFQTVVKLILEENEDQTVVKNHIGIDYKSKRLTFDEDYYKSTQFSAASPFGLIEELFPEDPWRVLVCTMLLNKTQRKQNLDSILYNLFKRWPTADSVVKDADRDEENVHLFVFALVRRAGQGHRKSRGFVQLSRDYLDLLRSKSQGMDENERRTAEGVEFTLTREEVKQLFNCGDYAADAYQIFNRRDFESPLVSNDNMLQAYVEWKRSLSILA